MPDRPPDSPESKTGTDEETEPTDVKRFAPSCHITSTSTPKPVNRCLPYPAPAPPHAPPPAERRPSQRRTPPPAPVTWRVGLVSGPVSAPAKCRRCFRTAAGRAAGGQCSCPSGNPKARSPAEHTGLPPETLVWLGICHIRRRLGFTRQPRAHPSFQEGLCSTPTDPRNPCAGGPPKPGS